MSKRRKSRWRKVMKKEIYGFTLLEVLMAVAILGLGLGVVLTGQFGAVKAVSHARQVSVATGLLRCKMTEIEEHLTREGYSEMDEHDSGACCEGDEGSGMLCEWRIEKPVFPEPKLGELDLDTDQDDLGALSLLAQSGQSQSAINPEDGLSGVADALAGGENDLSSLAAGGIGGLTSMVMSMVYPDLKAVFEQASRRITVKLTWSEGSRPYEITLVQWVTSPKQAGIVGALPDGETSSGTGTGTGTGMGSLFGGPSAGREKE